MKRGQVGSRILVFDKKVLKLLEGHGEEMMEIVGIEDAGIKVAGVHETEVFHTGIEVGIGHGARVLELTQDGIVEAAEISVGDDGTQCGLAGICDVMYRSRKPCKDVGFTVICQVSVEMMTLAGSDGTFLGNEGGAWTKESKRTKDMAFAITELPHRWYPMTMIFMWVTLSRIKIRLLFLSVLINEAQIFFVRIKDFEIDVLCWRYRMETMPEEP